jgi:glycosyltransferase involved in cell wall biosynthesis
VNSPGAKKKCLLLTFQAPRMPGGGGEVRSFWMVRTAASVFDLTVLNIGGLHGNGRVPPDLRSLCRAIIEPNDESTLTEAPSTGGRLAAWLRFGLTLLMPWQDHYRRFLRLVLQYGQSTDSSIPARLVQKAERFWAAICPIPPITCFMFDGAWRRIRSEALQTLKEQSFDLVWVEHTLAWPFAEQLLSLPKLRDVPVLCSGHNVEHLVCQRQASIEQQPLRSSFYQRQASLMQRMEVRAWQRAQLMLQCSEGDAAITRQLVPTARVQVIGNGVHGQYFQRGDVVSPAAPATVVFTAGFGYQPNVEALEWFLREILPRVRRTLPDVRFLFAGSEAAKAGELLAAEGRVSLAGVDWISDPPDIRPAFLQALVYVVPLLCGGGSRLKILEAMSMRVPVVSTTVGAEGVPYEHGKHLLIADGAEAFAAAVVQLLCDGELRGRLSDAAAEFVRAAYDWETVCGRLHDVLRSEFCA